MCGTISKALDNSTLLLPSVVFVLLSLISGSGRVSETPVERSFPSLQEQSNQTEAKSGTQTAADPQLKMVLDKMAAVGVVTRPKLGCYLLVSEVTDIRRNGEQIGFAKQSLVHIQLGEPDPWYFAIPTNYTARTGEEWNALILRLHQR